MSVSNQQFELVIEHILFHGLTMDKLLRKVRASVSIRRDEKLTSFANYPQHNFYQKESDDLTLILEKIDGNKYRDLSELKDDLSHHSADILLDHLIHLFEGLDMLGLFDGILTREPPMVIIPNHRQKKRVRSDRDDV